MIWFEDFTKHYGDHVAVDGLSLAIEPGEVAALLGPNGSGKTTSLKAVAGLLQPTSGSVSIGRPGCLASSPVARESISFLPQRVAFPDSLTAREVVEFYRRLRKCDASRSSEVLEFASLNGSSTRPVSTYSGGMVQRLGLAVAALPDSPVLLLDEPTAALDPAGLEAFYQLVERRRSSGKTLLFTSHQLGDVERIADRIAILVEGKLVALLTSRELAAKLDERGTMRLRVDDRPAAADAIRDMALGVYVDGPDLVIPGSPASRPAILERLSDARVEVWAISAEDGRLEDLYRELVEVPS